MKIRCVCALFVGSTIAITSVATAGDWPGFRGQNGGIAPEQDLPASLTKDNVLWKIKLPGVGTSSPIVYGAKVFLTAYSGYGTNVAKGMGGFGGPPKGGFGGPKGGPNGKFGGPKKEFGKKDFPKGPFGKGPFGGGPPDAEQKSLRLVALCLDAATGQVVWQKEIEPKLPENNFNGMISQHGYASSTPVTDGERVYFFFGKSGVLAYDLKGTELWRADVGASTNPMGSAASPVLYKDLLIVPAAIESEALVALDKKSGKEIWRTKGLGTSWSTPALVTTPDGKTEIVLSLPGKIASYDPESGKELWHCAGIGRPTGMGGTAPSPVAKDSIVYVTGGGGPEPLASIAVKAGGSGDVSKTHVLWRQRVGVSYSSPVVVGDRLCWIDGVVQGLQTSDGKSVAKERLYDSRGEFVSAVAAGSKVIALTRFNGLYVLDGGGQFAQLAHLEFDGDDSPFNASPAVSNGRLYVRSNDYLYCVGKKSQ